MRDPKKIERILALLGKIWEQEPDTRLCQLIYNLTYSLKNNYISEDIFYIEDTEFEKLMISYMKERGIE